MKTMRHKGLLISQEDHQCMLVWTPDLALVLPSFLGRCRDCCIGPLVSECTHTSPMGTPLCTSWSFVVTTQCDSSPCWDLERCRSGTFWALEAIVLLLVHGELHASWTRNSLNLLDFALSEFCQAEHSTAWSRSDSRPTRENTLSCTRESSRSLAQFWAQTWRKVSSFSF